MTNNQEEAALLKDEITVKLKDISLTEKKKREVEHLNNVVSNRCALPLRKMLLAFLNNNDDSFMNILEDRDSLLPEEKVNVEKIIQLYEAFVLICIAKNDCDQLGSILSYCNVNYPFFRNIFARICCIGHKRCLSVAIKRISLEKEEVVKVKKDPAGLLATLFDADFYRRIVQHDRIYLIQEMFSHEGITWNVPVMKRLAEERRCANVAAYLKGPQPNQTTTDSRKKLDSREREAFANKIKTAVKNPDIIKLENCLQDLEEDKKKYSNLDNVLNEAVSNEGKEYKNERLIHWACKQGDLSICKALYKKGASLRVVDSDSHTPAHVAIKANHLHVLQWLNDCDNYLIRDFFEYGWNDPSLDYLFRVEEKNVNLPILEYLLSLGCDKLLSKENIDHVLNQAIMECSGDYNCIDTLLKGEEVCNRITRVHLKHEAVEKDNQLLSRLLSAASRECIEEIIENGKEKSSHGRKFFKEWKKRCPEALPVVFSKFIEQRPDNGKMPEVNQNGKLIFKEISKLKDAQFLNHPMVFGYIQENCSTILPYYIDLVFIVLHLFCITCYCVIFGMRNVSMGENNNKQLVSNEIRYFFLVVNCMLFIKQMIEVCYKKCKFLNWQDFIETTSYGLSFAVLFRLYFDAWGLVVIILCLFISWMNLFMKLMVIPFKIGLYMEMFYSILKTFIRVLLMFSMFLLCFSTAFYTLFHKSEPFQSPHSIAGKTLAMMTGEFDFNDLFFPKEDCPVCSSMAVNGTGSLYSTMDPNRLADPNTSSSSPESTTAENPSTLIPGATSQNAALLQNVEYPSLVAYYVFFVFCICLHILLLNLLVGLAVDDISKIMDDSEGRRLRKQAELIADLEIFWRSWKEIRGRMNAVFNCFRCTGCDKSKDDTENESRTPFTMGEKGQPRLSLMPSNENHPLLSRADNVSPIESAPITVDLDEKLSKVEQNQKVCENKIQDELEEMTKTLDLMHEVIFQLHKQNRDMEKRMTEMAIENREVLNGMREEMNKRTKEILDKLSEPEVSTE